MDQPKKNDLTGLRFGELTVIKRLENTPGGATRWLCRCDCGNEYITLGSLLRNGRRTRCTGRAHAKNYAYTDITGQRFGFLEALKPLKRADKSGSMMWLCRCDCGNQVEVSYKHLAYGNQKSCGCRKKEQKQRLNSFLTHVAGTSMDIVKSKKLPADNTTGCKGVYLIKGKYLAKIVFQKKQYFLGTFDTLEAAAAARREAERVLFDEVAEHYQKWKLRAEIDAAWAEQNPIQISVSKQNGSLKVSLQPTL